MQQRFLGDFGVFVLSFSKIRWDGCVHTQIVKKRAEIGTFCYIPSCSESSLVFNGKILENSIGHKILA